MTSAGARTQSRVANEEAAVLFDAPGPKARARHRILAVVGSLAILALLAFAVVKLADPTNNQFAPEKWAPFLNPVSWTAYLIPGFVGTIVAAVLSVLLACLLYTSRCV